MTSVRAGLLTPNGQGPGVPVRVRRVVQLDFVCCLTIFMLFCLAKTQVFAVLPVGAWRSRRVYFMDIFQYFMRIFKGFMYRTNNKYIYRVNSIYMHIKSNFTIFLLPDIFKLNCLSKTLTLRLNILLKLSFSIRKPSDRKIC